MISRMHLVFSAIWPSVRRYWPICLITIGSMIAAICLTAYMPYLMRNFVNAFTSPYPDVAQAKQTFLQMVYLLIGMTITYRIMDCSLAFQEALTIADLENRSLEALQRQSPRFFEDQYSGSLITKSRRLRTAYEAIADQFYFYVGRNIIMLFAIAGAFFHAMPQLAWPFVGWSISFVAYNWLTALWKFPYNLRAAKFDSTVGGALGDNLSNQLVIKAFSQESAEQDRFSKHVQASLRARLNAWLRGDLVMTGNSLLIDIGRLALIWWLIIGWESGQVTAGDFVFVQSFTIWAAPLLRSLGISLHRVLIHVANAEEMAVILHRAPDVRDISGASPLAIQSGAISFRAVSFDYGNNGHVEDGAINDVSLDITAGQSFGLVGRSGAGKSTLIKLLARFYDPQAGSILIDGQDISQVKQASLRQQIAIVPQHAYLFHRSIRENILFARPEATEEEIIAAARQANAIDFIQQLAQGFNTLVGERGIKLSGGQQQRIAIARAILADRPILILDEATSHLDGETESLIQQAIASLLEDRTAIVIAHRLSTINQLDQIVVMDEGRIDETGQHTELVQSNGVYANLWLHHSGEVIA